MIFNFSAPRLTVLCANLFGGVQGQEVVKCQTPDIIEIGSHGMWLYSSSVRRIQSQSLSLNIDDDHDECTHFLHSMPHGILIFTGVLDYPQEYTAGTFNIYSV